MTTHSSILVLEIPWTEEPGRLKSMGSQRIGHDSAHTYTHIQGGVGVSDAHFIEKYLSPKMNSSKCNFLNIYF